MTETNLSADIHEQIERAKQAHVRWREEPSFAKQASLFGICDTEGAHKTTKKKTKIMAEQNLLELPFTVYNNRHSKVRDRIVIKKEDNVTVITALPDADGRFHGLPVPFDRKVLMTSMVHASSLRESNAIRMSRSQLCRHMGLKPSGQIYGSIIEAQNRLYNTNISMTKGWFDPKQKKRVSTSFRILSRVAEPSRDELVWWIDDVIADSFRKNYIKSLDYDRFISLKNSLAQFLYGFVMKKMGSKGLWRRNLEELLVDIGCGHYLSMEKRSRNQSIKRYVFTSFDDLAPDLKWSFDGVNVHFYR